MGAGSRVRGLFVSKSLRSSETRLNARSGARQTVAGSTDLALCWSLSIRSSSGRVCAPIGFLHFVATVPARRKRAEVSLVSQSVRFYSHVICPV